MCQQPRRFHLPKKEWTKIRPVRKIALCCIDARRLNMNVLHLRNIYKSLRPLIALLKVCCICHKISSHILDPKLTWKRSAVPDLNPQKDSLAFQQIEIDDSTDTRVNGLAYAKGLPGNLTVLPTLRMYGCTEVYLCKYRFL
jgi:hypothetical protein